MCLLICSVFAYNGHSNSFCGRKKDPFALLSLMPAVSAPKRGERYPELHLKCVCGTLMGMPGW